MTAPLVFDHDDAHRVLSVTIGLLELAAEAADGATGETFDSQTFDAAACLLTKARTVLEADMADRAQPLVGASSPT